MTKYPIMKTWGLPELLRQNDWYLPTGNKPYVVRNGFLGGQLLYDPKTKKVYGIALKEIEAPPEYIEKCEGEIAKEHVKDQMSYKEAQEWLEQHKTN